MTVEQFQRNLAQVHQRIQAAELRSGRTAGSVRLVGVTKYVDAPVIAELVAAGCLELGENRPQALWEKAETLNNPQIHWHLIGHLQRNKVKRTIELVTLIHSVDSDRLLRAIQDAAVDAQRVVKILLEVNVSGDTAKHGYAPGELAKAIENVAGCSNIQLQGLMCMAGLESTADEARLEFRQLRELRDALSNDLPANASLHELSMGMSGDFEMAIEEGATLVRIGSLLFDRV